MDVVRKASFLILIGYILCALSCCTHLCDDVTFSVGFSTDDSSYPWPILDTIGNNIDTFYVVVYEDVMTATAGALDRASPTQMGNAYAASCEECIDRFSVDLLTCDVDLYFTSGDTIDANTNLVADERLTSSWLSDSRLLVTSDLAFPIGRVRFQLEGDLDGVGRVRGSTDLYVLDSVTAEYAYCHVQ